MNRRQTRFVALVAAMLGGCATPITGQQQQEQAMRDLANAPLCCRTLADAKRKPLPLEPHDAPVDSSSQAFTFNGMKSFFVLYELPAFRKPYSITITSIAKGTLKDAMLLIPRVATFDSTFHQIRYVDEKTLRNRGNNLERTLFINPEDAKERYVAIFGSDLSTSVDRAYSRETVAAVMGGVVIYGGEDGKTTVRTSPKGMLHIEVRDLGP
ncbi:MAG: MalM family protein [Pseudomonadales bacterium]|jgi:hypothetical protein|nr:MalM family protein [Pseudomonadales bacterium]